MKKPKASKTDYEHWAFDVGLDKFTLYIDGRMIFKKKPPFTMEQWFHPITKRRKKKAYAPDSDTKLLMHFKDSTPIHRGKKRKI